MKMKNALRPTLEAPPTAAELDAQRHRTRLWFFGAWGIFAVVTFAVLVGTSLNLLPPNTVGPLVPLFFLVALLTFVGCNPWAHDRDHDWSPLEGDDLPQLKAVCESTAVDAVAIKQYRQAVSAMNRPLVRADLRRMARYQCALSVWLDQAAVAKEIAAYTDPKK
ncbi:TPA: hypothetical protein ACUNF5_005266 [Burkholderia orbicola]